MLKLDENQRNLSDQASVVKKLTKEEIKPIVHVIPGGKNMLDELDEKALLRAIKSWIRLVNKFTEFEINFSADTTDVNLQTTKVREFDTRDPILPWDRDSGKMTMATALHEVLFNSPESEKIVSVQLKKDGIYKVVDKDRKFSPESEHWVPHLVVIPAKRKLVRTA